jgi:hypothetical protein
MGWMKSGKAWQNDFLKRGRKKLTDLRRIWFAEKKLFGFDHGLW